MGSRSKGGYKDPLNYASALRLKKERKFPRPPRKLVHYDRRHHVRRKPRRELGRGGIQQKEEALGKNIPTEE